MFNHPEGLHQHLSAARVPARLGSRREKLRLLWMRWCGDLRTCHGCGAPYHKTRDAPDWKPEIDPPSLAGGYCADCGGD